MQELHLWLSHEITRMQVANLDFMATPGSEGRSVEPENGKVECAQPPSAVKSTAETGSRQGLMKHRLSYTHPSFGGRVSAKEVSKPLEHGSIKTTERHYAKWVKGRQDREDALVSTTWKTQTE